MPAKKRKRYIGWMKKTKQRRCVYCECTLTARGPQRMTADHVKPLSRGGYDKRKNVVACCYRCNQEKGSMTVGEFATKRRESAAPAH